MDFDIKKKNRPNKEQYSKTDYDIALDFARKINKEFSTMIKSVVMFGSSARDNASKKSDIDLLIVIDDISVYLSEELVQAYRIITEKIISQVSKKLHITTLKFTTFWEYSRAGDPVVINILRDGLAIYDTGFFTPLQILLKQGKIRPSHEAIWSYYSRTKPTLFNSKMHITQAFLDLYWAVVDASHAALMFDGQTPPTPEHISSMLKDLVKKKHLPTSCVNIAKDFYITAKKITHKEIKEISGKEYDDYLKKAEFFVDKVKNFLNIDKKFRE